MLSYAAPSLCTTPLTLLVAVHVMSFYEKIGANLSMLGIFVVCPRPCPAHAPTFVLTACRSRPPSASVQLTTARGVQVVARSFDAVSDPSMSYWTDSLRSKRGRRRPFLLTGCVPYSLSLLLLLTPGLFGSSDWAAKNFISTLSPMGSSIWFGIFYVLFFLCQVPAVYHARCARRARRACRARRGALSPCRRQTYNIIPYDALAPELTDNPSDRSRVFFFCTLFDGFGACAPRAGARARPPRLL